jgi:hypothetical protein
MRSRVSAERFTDAVITMACELWKSCYQRFLTVSYLAFKKEKKKERERENLT